MKPIDQCPSSSKEGKPGKEALAETARQLPKIAGMPAWRSLEEHADAPEFREWVEREFPAGASEMLEEGSRRDFIKLMGASVALAGAATIPGCRRPEHEIKPYSKETPEHSVPGKALYYATSLALPCGGAEGLLVETHEGRPTKIEGNPLHPHNRGKSSVWAQASVLELYDPDRLKFPVVRFSSIGEKTATWDDFGAWAAENLGKFDASQGAGLAVVVRKATGPTREVLRDQLKKRWPKMRWIAYDAAESRTAIDGAVRAFGSPQRELLSLSKAKAIVSLGRDFLSTTGEPNGLANAREYASTRRVLTTKDEMSRLYVAEPTYTITGGQADHRVSMAPSQIARLAVAIATRVLASKGGDAAAALRAAVAGKQTDLEAKQQAFAEAAADDLIAAGGAGLVVAGPTVSAEVHAIAHAINAVLGAIGTTVSFLPMSSEQAADGMAEVGALAGAINSGEVNTVVCIGANPVYDAPAGADFAAAFAKATTITWSVSDSETAHASNWSLNGAHWLESWGDTEAWDGTVAPVQPMIAPLYEPAMSEIEFLTMLAQVGIGGSKATPKVVGYEILRGAWQSKLGQVGFEKVWTRALFDGVLANSAPKPAATPVKFESVVAAAKAMTLEPAPSGAGVEVVFQTNHMYDGRFANVAWLQELPDAGSRVVWDNPALVSPRTAVAMGLAPYGLGKDMSLEKASNVYTDPKYPTGRVVTLAVGGKSMEVAIWIAPGVADNTVVLTLGYGRTQCGLVGNGTGFNTFAVYTGARLARGATASDTGRTYMIASTQTHWSLEGRTSLVRGLDYPGWKKFGDDSPKEYKDRLYGTKTSLNLAERIGHSELTHTPPNISIYKNPFNATKNDPGAGSRYSEGPQWAMSIDLSTCTGCGACTIACQAENNIPVVGKKDVAKGREMTWIRVDRYFTGDDANNPEAMLHQPVACVHCENAPCEVVCPVNATIHGEEGLNYMAYNRCIGTRYCANNCPYKVRRFNFHDYGVAKFKGDYIGKDVFPQAGERNANLIPPRLRERLNEIEKMQKNPNVTIRSRGVMEKCSFCVQRINAAKIEVKLKNIEGAPSVPEGFFQTACQQACPSEAIVFGDMLDTNANNGKGSLIRQMREHNRTYALLGFLNTRPRTTHMAAVKNPNRGLLEKLGKSERLALMDDPFGHHGEGHHDDGHGTGDTGHDAGKTDGHAAPAAPAGAGHSSAVPIGSPSNPSRSIFLRDSAKKAADRGYALSLSVLTGFHA